MLIQNIYGCSSLGSSSRICFGRSFISQTLSSFPNIVDSRTGESSNHKYHYCNLVCLTAVDLAMSFLNLLDLPDFGFAMDLAVALISVILKKCRKIHGQLRIFNATQH